jgi:hypothetical protein
VSRRSFFRFSEWVTGYRSEKRRFEKKLGYPLNLQHPTSFNEKMCWRKINDRNPLFPIIVDKVAVRQYIADVLGHDRAQEILVPLLLQVRDPEDIPFDSLPSEYVIKASHGSGMNILVRQRCPLTRHEIVQQCRGWLGTTYGAFKHEWAYEKVVPQIIVESLLKDASGNPVKEYKFHMFDGKCGLIQAHHAKVWDDGSRVIDDDAPTLTFYTENWSKIDVSWVYRSGPAEPPPINLAEMMSTAEALSNRFDYLRVDFYAVRDGFKVGELTPYHLSGTGRLEPREFDFELGSKWRLPRG